MNEEMYNTVRNCIINSIEEYIAENRLVFPTESGQSKQDFISNHVDGSISQIMKKLEADVMDNCISSVPITTQ